VVVELVELDQQLRAVKAALAGLVQLLDLPLLELEAAAAVVELTETLLRAVEELTQVAKLLRVVEELTLAAAAVAETITSVLEETAVLEL
jgi:hypothetical protein